MSEVAVGDTGPDGWAVGGSEAAEPLRLQTAEVVAHSLRLACRWQPGWISWGGQEVGASPFNPQPRVLTFRAQVLLLNF